MKKTILLFLLFTLLFPLQAKSTIDVSKDANNVPIEQNNQYFINMNYVEGLTYLENNTDHKITTYYENEKGRWIKYYSIYPGKKLKISIDNFDPLHFLCIEYKGKSTNKWNFNIKETYNSVEEELIYKGTKYENEHKETIIQFGNYPAKNLLSYEIKEEPHRSTNNFATLQNDVIKRNSKNNTIAIENTYILTNYSLREAEIVFRNLSQKRIKYIYFTLIPLNRVGDKLKPSTIREVKTTDFIEPYDIYDAYYYDLWEDSTISDFSISNIRIIYDDNTEFSQTIDVSNKELYFTPNLNRLVFYEDANISLSCYKEYVYSTKNSKSLVDSEVTFTSSKKYPIYLDEQPYSFNSYVEYPEETNEAINKGYMKDNFILVDNVSYKLTGNDKVEINPFQKPIIKDTSSITIKYTLSDGSEQEVIITDPTTIKEVLSYTTNY